MKEKIYKIIMAAGSVIVALIILNLYYFYNKPHEDIPIYKVDWVCNGTTVYVIGQGRVCMSQKELDDNYQKIEQQNKNRCLKYANLTAGQIPIKDSKFCQNYFDNL